MQAFIVHGSFEIVYLLLEKDIFDYVIMEGQKQFRRMLWQQLVLIWGTTNSLAVTYREGEVELFQMVLENI